MCAATRGVVDNTGQVSARSVLYEVLYHHGAECSAHETLAAECGTVAQTAQAQRFTAALTASSLGWSRVQQILDGDSFGPLIAQLRRAEADGHQPEGLLTQVMRAP